MRATSVFKHVFLVVLLAAGYSGMGDAAFGSQVASGHPAGLGFAAHDRQVAPEQAKPTRVAGVRQVIGRLLACGFKEGSK